MAQEAAEALAEAASAEAAAAEALAVEEAEASAVDIITAITTIIITDQDPSAFGSGHALITTEADSLADFSHLCFFLS